MNIFKPKVIEKVVFSSDPIEVVNRLTKKDFEWFDYSELDEGERQKYYQQAQSVLTSDVFNNEINKLNAEFAEWASKKSTSWDDVLAMRHQISGLMLLKERLESVLNPIKKEDKVTEPYNGI